MNALATSRDAAQWRHINRDEIQDREFSRLLESVEESRFTAACLAKIIADDSEKIGVENSIAIWGERMIQVGREYGAAMKAATDAAMAVLYK